MPKVPHLQSLVLYKVGATEILKGLANGEGKRFGDLAKLGGTKTTATLAHRLRELERADYIIKKVHNEPGQPVNIYYKITDKGKKALDLFRTLESL